MNLEDLLKLMDENIKVYINDQEYSKDVPKEMLSLKVVECYIETGKPSVPTLETLGYSFEVGV